MLSVACILRHDYDCSTVISYGTFSGVAIYDVGVVIYDTTVVFCIDASVIMTTLTS